jgi:hypothetical protein
VLERARDRLLARAASLGPRADRGAFCGQVPHNAEILRLAELNLGPVRAATEDGQVRRAAK